MLANMHFLLLYVVTHQGPGGDTTVASADRAFYSIYAYSLRAARQRPWRS